MHHRGVDSSGYIPARWDGPLPGRQTGQANAPVPNPCATVRAVRMEAVPTTANRPVGACPPKAGAQVRMLPGATDPPSARIGFCVFRDTLSPAIVAPTPHAAPGCAARRPRQGARGSLKSVQSARCRDSSSRQSCRVGRRPQADGAAGRSARRRSAPHRHSPRLRFKERVGRPSSAPLLTSHRAW